MIQILNRGNTFLNVYILLTYTQKPKNNKYFLTQTFVVDFKFQINKLIVTKFLRSNILTLVVYLC